RGEAEPVGIRARESPRGHGVAEFAVEIGRVRRVVRPRLVVVARAGARPGDVEAHRRGNAVLPEEDEAVDDRHVFHVERRRLPVLADGERAVGDLDGPEQLVVRDVSVEIVYLLPRTGVVEVDRKSVVQGWCGSGVCGVWS